MGFATLSPSYEANMRSGLCRTEPLQDRRFRAMCDAFERREYMALDKADVAHIAKLARIRLSEAELEPLAAELSGILNWVEQLAEVDTADVAPMTSVAAVGLPMRADVVTDGNNREAVLGNAPQSARGFFTVPKVVE